MNRCRQTMCVLLGLLLLATAGCGGSAADKAMQDVLDVMLEMKEAEGSEDMSKGLELIGRMAEAGQKLDAEMKKMSEEEQKAFLKRWEEKFKAAGVPVPPSG